MTRILIVDDHQVVRDGLKRIIDGHLGSVYFGEARDPAEALDKTLAEEWDLVILDLSLGGRGGIEVLKDIRRMKPRLPVLILTMHSEEQYAVRAFRAGATGYVSKDTPSSELASAIRKVLAGGRYVSPALAEALAIAVQHGGDRLAHESLSDREFQVLRMIASGHTVKEVASLLNLSDKTVSTYRTRILDKMSMKTNAELTFYAIQQKLV
jgi:DNA-binding NarL/FixJ family response regulator